MSNKPYTVVLAVGLLAVSFNTFADDKGDAMAACDAAESARKAAAQVKMEWTSTGKLIKAGNEAIEKGEFATALKSCNKAKFEGDAAVDQASREALAWKTRVPQ